MRRLSFLRTSMPTFCFRNFCCLQLKNGILRIHGLWHGDFHAPGQELWVYIMMVLLPRRHRKPKFLQQRQLFFGLETPGCLLEPFQHRYPLRQTHMLLTALPRLLIWNCGTIYSKFMKALVLRFQMFISASTPWQSAARPPVYGIAFDSQPSVQRCAMCTGSSKQGLAPAYTTGMCEGMWGIWGTSYACQPSPRAGIQLHIQMACVPWHQKVCRCIQMVLDFIWWRVPTTLAPTSALVSAAMDHARYKCAHRTAPSRDCANSNLWWLQYPLTFHDLQCSFFMWATLNLCRRCCPWRSETAYGLSLAKPTIMPMCPRSLAALRKRQKSSACAWWRRLSLVSWKAKMWIFSSCSCCASVAALGHWGCTQMTSPSSPKHQGVWFFASRQKHYVALLSRPSTSWECHPQNLWWVAHFAADRRQCSGWNFTYDLNRRLPSRPSWLEVRTLWDFHPPMWTLVAVDLWSLSRWPWPHLVHIQEAENGASTSLAYPCVGPPVELGSAPSLIHQVQERIIWLHASTLSFRDSFIDIGVSHGGQSWSLTMPMITNLVAQSHTWIQASMFTHMLLSCSASCLMPLLHMQLLMCPDPGRRRCQLKPGTLYLKRGQQGSEASGNIEQPATTWSAWVHLHSLEATRYYLQSKLRTMPACSICRMVWLRRRFKIFEFLVALQFELYDKMT